MNLDRQTYPARRWAIRIVALLAAYQVAAGMYFIALRPSLLPEDLRFMKLATLPDEALPWLHLVFTVLGGQMVAGGLLLVPFIASLKSQARLGALSWVCFIGAGLTSVGLMCAVNFLLSSDFRWVLLIPAVAWGIAILLVSASRRAH